MKDMATFYVLETGIILCMPKIIDQVVLQWSVWLRLIYSQDAFL